MPDSAGAVVSPGVVLWAGVVGAAVGAVVATADYGQRKLYAMESPENWFEDFGEGQLVEGRCHIELDAIFLETVTIDAMNPMHVFVQPYDEACRDLVVKRGDGGFDVVNPAQPDAAGAFSYRVVAKRKGFEAKRLDVCEAERLVLEATSGLWAAQQTNEALAKMESETCWLRRENHENKP